MRRNLYTLITLLLLSSIVSCTPLAPANSVTSIINSAIFVSDSGKTIQAMYRDNDTVTLTFANGSKEVLDLAVSASGARYIAGTHEWWEHQGEASYSVDDKLIFTGRRQR